MITQLKTYVRKIRDETGAVEMTAFVLLSWIVIMLAIAGVDIFLMSSRFITVSNIAQKTLEMMKDEGMLTAEIEDIFFAELEQQNIGQDAVKVVSATTNQTLRGDPIHFHVKARYLITSFRPLGMTDEMLTMEWDIQKTGISRKFIRHVPVL